MNNLINFFFNFKQNQTLPPNFKILPDGTFILKDEATVWDDQLANKISPDNTMVTYYLAESEYESPTAYAVYKDKVWIKGTFKPNETITYTFQRNEEGKAENEKVFMLYDDFDSYNNNLWTYKNSSLSNGQLIVNGGNQIIGATTTFAIPEKVVIEWKMYSGNYDFDSGIKVGNLYFISDKGSYNHAISTGWTYPVGSQQANAWNEYQVIIEQNKQTFKNITRNKTVNASYSYNMGNLSFICDSDTSSNPLKVDYICIRKYYDTSKLEITSYPIENGYTVEIKNIGEEVLEDIEVELNDIPVDKYKVTVKSITPVIETWAFPAGVNSSVSFFTQFNHRAKYNSKCAFHIHCYIPPDATTGNIKLKFEWQKLPVETLVTGGNIRTVRQVNKQLSSITKIFPITEEMKGRHVLFDFGFLDTVHSISQVVFAKVTRLGADTEDNWNFDLPILYLDFHTEIDTMGSREQFIKY